MRILLVEDDPLIADAVTRFLTQKGHVLDVAKGEHLARQLLREIAFDLIVLDWRLDEGDGLSLLRWLRRQPPPLQGVAVLMLTAMDAVAMRVEGLEAGADDYLIKPFDLHELHARILALGRRKTPSCSSIMQCGDLTLDLTHRTLQVAGQPIDLPNKERAVLEVLMRHCGKTVTRERLHALLYDLDGDIASNTLEVFISHLRKRLGSERIQTLRGIGYRLRCPEAR
jgi:two-component system OmpR family response regulator